MITAFKQKVVGGGGGGHHSRWGDCVILNDSDAVCMAASTTFPRDWQCYKQQTFKVCVHNLKRFSIIVGNTNELFFNINYE